MIDLSSKTVLITGGSRGIGAAAAVLFAKAGADIVLTYHTRADEAEQVVAQVKGLGRRAWAFGGDHADPRAAHDIFARIQQVVNVFDAAVINHGIWPAEDVALGEMTEERWNRTMRTIDTSKTAAEPVAQTPKAIIAHGRAASAASGGTEEVSLAVGRAGGPSTDEPEARPTVTNSKTSSTRVTAPVSGSQATGPPGSSATYSGGVNSFNSASTPMGPQAGSFMMARVRSRSP